MPSSKTSYIKVIAYSHRVDPGRGRLRPSSPAELGPIVQPNKGVICAKLGALRDTGKASLQPRLEELEGPDPSLR